MSAPDSSSIKDFVKIQDVYPIVLTMLRKIRMPNLKDDFDSLVGKACLSEDVDRRTFIKAALGTGFAIAIIPVCAQTVIKTDAAGLTAGLVEVQMKGDGASKS